MLVGPCRHSRSHLLTLRVFAHEVPHRQRRGLQDPGSGSRTAGAEKACGLRVKVGGVKRERLEAERKTPIRREAWDRLGYLFPGQQTNNSNK